MTTIKTYKTEERFILNVGKISDQTFNRFSQLIYHRLGIKMPISKKNMLQARLMKRLRELRISTYEEYYEYLTSEEGLLYELGNMVNVVTTNKTDFFRENKHFEFLSRSLLPSFYNNHKGKPLKIWSAGCSIGAEPYTMAMVLFEFAESHPNFTFNIWATDISTHVLEKAKLGIYDHGMAEPIPFEYRKKYLLRSKNQSKELIRVIPRLRSVVRFKPLNFMDDVYDLKETMDIVFCRNVIIYFDRQTQENVLNKICRHLRSGGYLFMGHSETLNTLNVPVKAVLSTIYRKI